jgi:hypothetical protein
VWRISLRDVGNAQNFHVTWTCTAHPKAPRLKHLPDVYEKMGWRNLPPLFSGFLNKVPISAWEGIWITNLSKKYCYYYEIDLIISLSKVSPDR